MTFLSQVAQQTLALEQEAQQRELDQLQTEEASAKAKAEEEALDAALDTQSEQEQALAEDFSEMDEVTATAQELEKVEGFVSARYTEGGMTPNEAQAIEIATESIYRRLGIDVRPIARAALEGYKHPVGRKEVTLEALDNIKETVKKIWEAIKKFAMNIWEKIKLFIASFQVAQKLLVKRAEKLKAEAEAYQKLGGDNPPPKPVTAYLEIKGKSGDYVQDKQKQAVSDLKISKSISHAVNYFVDDTDNGGVSELYKFFRSQGALGLNFSIQGIQQGSDGNYYFGEAKGERLNQIYISNMDLNFRVDSNSENVQKYEINALTPSEVAKTAGQVVTNLNHLIDAIDAQARYLKQAGRNAIKQVFTSDADARMWMMAAITGNRMAMNLLQATAKVFTNQERRTLQTLSESMKTWPSVKDLKLSDGKELATA